MSVRFKTVLKEGKQEMMVEKSKFIGHVKPVLSKEEAESFIAEIKRAHSEATHNVPVYLLGEHFDIQRYSDDGEPSGTAGVPVLSMLMKEGITNVAIVITRYFGGIKLGTGGLLRAYTGAAKAALTQGGIAEVKDMEQLEVKVDYTYHGKLENLSLNGDFTILKTDFLDCVIMQIQCDPDVTEQVKQQFQEFTSGKCQFLKQEKILEKVLIT